jgi:cysteine synthase
LRRLLAAQKQNTGELVAFVADNTCTMKGAKIQALRKCLKKAVDEITSRDRYELIVIKYDNSVAHRYLTSDETQDKTDINQFIDSFTASSGAGGTEFHGPLNRLSDELERLQHIKSLKIVFLTDGTVCRKNETKKAELRL